MSEEIEPATDADIEQMTTRGGRELHLLARIDADRALLAEQDRRIAELEDLFRTYSLAAGEEYSKATARIAALEAEVADLRERLQVAESTARVTLEAKGEGK